MRRVIAWGCLLAALCQVGTAEAANLDRTLQLLLRVHDVGPVDPGPDHDPALVELGRMLFYDRLLSGNRDISCATCHHDLFATGDALSLPIGTGGIGLGPGRVKGEGREFVPRNAPEIFNRGSREWTTMFWDSRVEEINGHFFSPAGPDLPEGFSNVLEIQAMFPVTSRDELRGAVGDLDVFGYPNELAAIPDNDLPGIWQAIMMRLLGPDGAANPNVPSYMELFADAFPDVPFDELGFEHAAIAIGAYEAEAFTLLDSPWDRYLDGERGALTESAKRGAILFYGRAGCVRCHSGSLMTDQEHHNILIPQLGPGKAPSAPEDRGRVEVTGYPLDRYRFRTPPLRNVAATGPWTHDGAYTTLEGVVRHHFNPVRSFLQYDASQLEEEELQHTVSNSVFDLVRMLPTADPRVVAPRYIAPRDMNDLLAFLESLTSPSLDDLVERNLPDEVPSGLPVDGVLPQE